MTASASSIRSAPLPLEPIKEDSHLLRTIGCIPFFGAISTMFVEASLRQQCNQTKNEPRLIELIHIKNQYKVVNVTRNLLVVAVTIAAIAYKMIPVTLFITLCIGVHLAMAGLSIYRRDQNIEVIKELETTGFRAGMQVW